MVDENQTPNESKSRKEQLRARARGASNAASNAVSRMIRVVAGFIARVLRLLIWNPVTIGLVMFIVGARMYETGRMAGFMGRDLKGATIYLSGNCNVDNRPRIPALAEDQVKVTYMDHEVLKGVVRKTREIVECKTQDIAIDSLPLIANFLKSPERIPELTLPIHDEQAPDFMKYDKQTLSISGTCITQDNKALPSFTDEKVDVTDIQADKDNRNSFMLYGVRRSDKLAIHCNSSSIKYNLASGDMMANQPPPKNVDPSMPEVNAKPNLVEQMILITGACLPDERTKVNKIKKYAYYKFANTRVQVLKQELNSKDEVQRLVVSVMDEPYRGDIVVCDEAKIPFIWKQYDPDNTKLENRTATENQDQKNSDKNQAPPQNLPGNEAVVPEQPAAPQNNDVVNPLEKLTK